MIDSFKTAIANIIIIVLCLGMVGAGMIKLMSLPQLVEWWDAWGLPHWFRYVIGAFEFVIGLCIWIPQTRKYALYALIIEMIGAFTLHMAYEEFWDARGPILVLIAASLLLYLKYYQTSK
jgi:uncharacterized membrane protein YphA (DoxX/SURF4 family)